MAATMPGWSGPIPLITAFVMPDSIAETHPLPNPDCKTFWARISGQDVLGAGSEKSFHGHFTPVRGTRFFGRLFIEWF